ncbi:unnamed protein product [Linum trigynum]|uniref:Replication protein A 70 kDa DNA-binding subunit B/D first OB fold domain-containing protein n=1 Tax=Linum trigynum TaxID=586398 RepID=A0AAV2E7L6_9ROSI
MPLLSLAHHLNQHNDDSTVRVRLLRLWQTMRPDGIIIEQFHMLFLDKQGTKIEGLVDTDEIPLFDPFLPNEGRIYKLTNFHVRPYEDDHRVSPATLRICFREDTVVEELPNEQDIPAYNFRFLDAADLPNAVHNHAYMSDIIGVLVLADPEEALFEDIALLRRKSVLLRGPIVEIVLWDDLIDHFDAVMPNHPNPGVVVVFTFVVVHHFNGQAYCVASNATKTYWNLHYPIAHTLLHILENVNLDIDYTFEDVIWVSEPCSIPELNLYKNDINNQGSLYISAGQVQDVDVLWSAKKLKYLVRMIVANGVDEGTLIFTTGKFRWIASRIIEESDKEWSNNFRNLLAYLRGNSFKFMVEVGNFNPVTNDFNLVLRKLFS